MGYGHQSSNCKGPNRSERCWKCSGNGHVIRVCTKQPICMQNGRLRKRQAKMMEITQVNRSHCDVAQFLPIMITGWWIKQESKLLVGSLPTQEVVDSNHDGFIITKFNGVFV